jgi:diguanylate cyclase (GGDEF)-like protein
MRHLAHYVALTQLPNRTLFLERLEHALVKSRREGNALALLFIDLDYFKAVNDSLGHAAGDDLLRILAKRMTDAIRQSDTVARLSGDEFALFIEDLDAQASIDGILRKMLDALLTPATVAGRLVTIGASIGVAIFPRDGKSAESLLRAADTAMTISSTSTQNRGLLWAASSGPLLGRRNQRNTFPSLLLKKILQKGIALASCVKISPGAPIEACAGCIASREKSSTRTRQI